MASLKTVRDLKELLSKSGPLSSLLRPEDFTGEGDVADTMASDYKKSLKPTQTRRIFHTIKQLEHQVRREADEKGLTTEQRTRLTLLGPELAYAAGRELIPKEFYEILKLGLRQDKLQTVGDLRRLVQFLTAIVAYQKFHGQFDSRN